VRNLIFQKGFIDNLGNGMIPLGRQGRLGLRSELEGDGGWAVSISEVAVPVLGMFWTRKMRIMGLWKERMEKVEQKEGCHQ